MTARRGSWRGRRIAGAAVAAALLAAAPAHAASPCGQHPWCDTSLSPDARAALLLHAMTEQEEVSLLGGDDVQGSLSDDRPTGTSDGVARLGIPTMRYSDGPVGPRYGPATAMPAPIGLAATWQPSLARLVGETIADEAAHKGADAVFAPTVDIMRVPLAGRTFETYGEDPLLTSRLAVPWIEGAQRDGTIAVVKHFALNNQEGQHYVPPGCGLDGCRYVVNGVVDERTLREIYLPAFEAAVKQAHVGSVMCAYNRVNGTYACESHRLLQEILEREWGFPGFVVADYGAAHDAIASLNGGLDFEAWPPLAYQPGEIDAALAGGLVSRATLDEHVRRILRTMFAFGVFDRAPRVRDDAAIDKAAHMGVAERVEERAITLLQNRGGVLPLRADRVRSIAVIGSDATAFRTGGGSADVTPFQFVSPLAGIRARAGDGVRVTYDGSDDPATAAATAKQADVAIVFAADAMTEGQDKACLTLECPGSGASRNLDGLIEAVARANPRTVVVLETGGPVLTPWRDSVAGLVEAWYPGAAGGAALARVLFGDADPGGRLPATFPRSESDLPTAGDPRRYPGVDETVDYSEGVLVGYRSYDARGVQPAFPFGFGLSYGRFRLSGLRIHGPRVAVTVRNVSRRRATTVVQLYVGVPPPAPGVVEPPRALAGFRRVTLPPGRAARVRMTIAPRSLSYWDTGAAQWTLPDGCDRIWLGFSSRDLPLGGALRVAGGRVHGPSREPPRSVRPREPAPPARVCGAGGAP